MAQCRRLGANRRNLGSSAKHYLLNETKGNCGKVKSGAIRDLRGTVEREGAAMGLFITLEESSRVMRTEAVSAGFYHSVGWGQDYLKIQILTIEELLHGAEIKMPPQYGTFKEAQRVRMQGSEQSQLDLG